MNTKNLETLMAIIETGSFQKAATRLDYTPSAVTSQIKQLENELSIKLFEKIGRKMELTQAATERSDLCTNVSGKFPLSQSMPISALPSTIA